MSITMASKAFYLPVGVIFLLMALLLGCAVATEMFSSEFTHRIIGSELSQVTVDPDTGDVYVAGSNIIARLDEDLGSYTSLTTGPVLDSTACDPTDPRSCRGLTSHDNEARILELDPDSRQLIFCGTVHQGLCSLIPADNDLLTLTNLSTANQVNYAGSRLTNFAFFADGVDRSGHVLYVSSTYDGRPVSLSQPALSARRLSPTGSSYDLQYANLNPALNQRTAVTIDQTYIEDYRVKYVYGFQYNGFTYFLTLQRQNIDTTGSFEARLARVCQNDPGFYSYTELRLSCRKRNGITTFYNIPQAAYLAEVGDLRTRLGASRNDKILYVLYGRSKDKDNDTADPSYGTGLCGYAMSGVEQEFVKAQKNCYMEKGSLLEWIQPNRHCKKDLKIATSIDTSFCGSPLNVGIDSRYSHSSNTETLQTTDYLTTSLAVVIYRGRTIAIMGTSTGEILKMLVSARNQPPYAVIPVGHGLSHPGVGKDMAFDLTREYLYILTGDVITKVPLLSCDVYTDCAQCVLTRDPLGCGWCKDKCTRNEQCTGNFSPDSCPPVLYNFMPKSGPLEGGTLLTIHGRYFGNATASRKQTQATVTVAYQQCDILHRNTSVILCRTSSAPNSTDREVQVEVMDMTNTTEQFAIRGSDSSRHVSFSYKVPKIWSFLPVVGPKSGGTKLTITGQYLDIGSNLAVTVAGLPCDVYRKSMNEIICTTSSWHRKLVRWPQYIDQSVKTDLVTGVTDAPNYGPVNVTIDSARLHIANSVFTYENDPVVDDIAPKHSIMSGGFPINVTGANLHIITNPKIEAMALNGDGTKYYENCTVYHDGSWMLCLSPNISTTSAVMTTMDPSVPIQVAISSVLDAVTPHSVIFNYYVDPIIRPFDSRVKYFYTDDVFLQIHGQYIDFAASEDNVDVYLDEDKCNVTVIGTTIIICKPERIQQDTDVERIVTVTVRIGRRIYNVGQLQFSNHSTDFFIMTTLGPALGVLGIVSIVLLLSWMKKTRRGPFQKKIPRDQRVRYTNGSSDSRSAREQTYRLPVENPYWSSTSHLMCNRHTLVEPRRRQPILDDESRRLIDDNRLMISRDRIILLEIIGQGHFGCVYRGFLKVGEEKDEIEIAVKTLKSLTENTYVNSLDAKRFLEEALRMREFDHPHILRLIGIALDKEDLPLVVLPFMKHGDLLSYIRNEENSPTVKNLIDFGIQIAEGMAYLANLKFVHRDLAARNCMLDDDMNIKVADFGLSRDIYERDYYSSDDRKAKLPVKWMALESLEKGIYNTKTDVWSYGVVLWELMTRGVCPYPEVDNWDIIKYLKIGRRMPQPSYCPDSLYAIMLDCWDTDPKMRPSFAELVHHVKSIIITMQQMQQKVSVTATYINVPTTQGYLYPQVTNPNAMSTLV